MQAVEFTLDIGNVVFRGLRYEAQDAGPTTPLVLFHGFTGSAVVWKELALEWSARRTVFAIDLPYHGGTVCAAGLTWSGHLDALSRLLQQLSAGPFHLLGYSMGARLALGLAITGAVPLKSLTLESVHPGLRSASERDQRRQQDQRWREMLLTKGIEVFADAWEKLPHWQTQRPQESRTRLHKSIRRNQLPELLSESLHHVGLAEQPFLGGSLQSLAFPVHLITGGEDVKFTRLSADIRTLIPQARLSLFHDCGHSINIESPVEYAAVTEHFFHDSDLDSPQFTRP